MRIAALSSMRTQARSGTGEPMATSGSPSRSTSSISSVVIGTLRVMTPSTRFHSMFCDRGRRWS